MRASRIIVVCFFTFLIRFAAAEAPTTQPTYSGEWQTSYGTMTMVQKGEVIEGSYGPDAAKATISGKLEGKKFSFTYQEPAAAGEGWFELAADGNSFKGQWRENGSKVWAEWVGRRKAPLVQLDSFAGLWKTTYGRMRLTQSGKEVRGTYDFGSGANISGTIEGKTFKFTYDQPDGEKGEGTFELAADGKTFAGTWKGAKGGDDAGGKWTGSRVVPIPGRVWLVVLEANWERDLEEEEYSFGVMLRTFFSRVPTVKVRHRFFGNEAEFVRWCSELQYMAEPVVLHISSHGTAEGISCGGKTIGAKTITECLKNVGDLKLLHFGTCLIAGGPIPGEIHKSLGERATFPISGYKNSADWGGSAVVDFTFLDLMFSKGLSPQQAIAQTRKMLSFAGDGKSGDAVAPCGLVVIEPAK